MVKREIREELSKAARRVAVLELRVFTVTASVKILRAQISGESATR